MSIEHKDIPEAGLHEPKGVSTATSGTVYVATGSGSGTWKSPQIVGQSGAVDGTFPVSDGAGGVTWDSILQYASSSAINVAQTIPLTAASLRSTTGYVSVTQYFTSLTETLSGITIDSTTKNIKVSIEGYYEVHVWASIGSSAINATIGMLRTLNGTPLVSAALAQYKSKSAGDIATVSSYTLKYFSAGDVIGYALASDTSTNITLYDGFMSVRRVL